MQCLLIFLSCERHTYLNLLHIWAHSLLTELNNKHFTSTPFQVEKNEAKSKPQAKINENRLLLNGKVGCSISKCECVRCAVIRFITYLNANYILSNNFCG